MELLVVFGIGLVASFFASFMSGGLSLISLTAMLAYGIQPHIAIAALGIGAYGFNLGGLVQYARNDKVVWDMFWPLTIIGIFGSTLGGLWLVGLSEDFLSRAIGLAILIFIPLSLYNKKLGVVEQVTSLRRRVVGYANFFFLSFYGGSIGIGYGLFAVYNMMLFFGLPILKAKASGKLPGMIAAVGAIVVFALNGIIDWRISLVLLVGMLIGGYVGTHYAIKLGDSWLRIILLVTIALFSLKLILGL